MLKKTFNQLLDKHFSLPVERSLDGLEGDVMRRIRLMQVDEPEAWYEKMFAAFSVPRFQMACLALAFFVGVGASSMVTFNDALASDEVWLEEFSDQAPQLSLNLSEYLK